MHASVTSGCEIRLLNCWSLFILAAFLSVLCSSDLCVCLPWFLCLREEIWSYATYRQSPGQISAYLILTSVVVALCYSYCLHWLPFTTHMLLVYIIIFSAEYIESFSWPPRFLKLLLWNTTCLCRYWRNSMYRCWVGVAPLGIQGWTFYYLLNYAFSSYTCCAYTPSQ